MEKLARASRGELMGVILVQQDQIEALVARKIAGGTRSPKGSHTKMGLMSLFGTWQVQGKTLLESCRQLLLSNSPA